MPSRTRAASATRFLLVLTACMLALILTAGWMIRQNIERTKSAANDIATRVMEAIQVRPKVVVNHRTVIEQQHAALKFITLEKTTTERERLDESWLHSTKTLEIEADFVIRGGFDLTKPFEIEVDHATGELRVALPPAEILSVELRDVRFLRDEDGWWNSVSAGDRELLIRDLRLRVAAKARQSDFTQQARDLGEKRIARLLETGGRYRVTFPSAGKFREP